MIRVLIVEDEPPALRRLRSLLKSHTDIEIVGEAMHASDAVDLIESLRPDVVLLDIELSVATGFEVIEAIGIDRMPAVIFITAYNQYAIRAFEVHAIDYLLKPVGAERLAAALLHVRQRLGNADKIQASHLGHVLDEVRQSRNVKRIAVRHKGRIVFVDIADIDYVVADGNYVRVTARGADYLIRDTLNAYEAKLRPHGFLRIHRGIIVQIGKIIELQPLFHGEYSVRLSDGRKLVSGRTYRDQMRIALSLKDDL